MVYFDQTLCAYACRQFLLTDMRNNLFDGRGFAEQQFDWSWSVNKILITFELQCIFGSFLHTYLFKNCPVFGMQNGDEAAWRI